MTSAGDGRPVDPSGDGRAPTPPAAMRLAASDTTRRTFLTGSLAAGATLPLVGWGRPGKPPASPRPPAGLTDDLFSLGVASGDPLPRAVVIWTRLAPAPLEGGGMPAVDV